MKRNIFIVIATLMAMVAFTSCDPNGNNQPEFIYSLETTGDAEGLFSLGFPNGNFSTNGKADLTLVWYNDTTSVNKKVSEEYVELIDALQDTENAELNTTALKVNSWVDNSFKVIEADGKYYLHIVGCVTETKTGITLMIDKTLTNKSEDELYQEAMEEND